MGVENCVRWVGLLWEVRSERLIRQGIHHGSAEPTKTWWFHSKEDMVDQILPLVLVVVVRGKWFHVKRFWDHVRNWETPAHTA